MPRISQFYGISVYMYYQDHQPAHFHAIYGDYEAIIDIETASVLEGRLPRRAESLVIEWAVLHRDELRENWNRARAGQPLVPVPPLD